MEQQQLRSESMKEGKFTRQFAKHNWRAVREHAARTGWAVVVDENDQPVMIMNPLLEDLPPLFADED